MYLVNTNQNSDYTEALVYADIIKKGWMPLLPSSRDCYYDLVVDLGDRFVRVQVKKLNLNKGMHRVVKRGNQRVTKNGKVRNAIDYAERGVEWLVGVDVTTGEIYYYSLEKYRTLGHLFSVTAHAPDEFPINHNVTTNNTGETYYIVEKEGVNKSNNDTNQDPGINRAKLPKLSKLNKRWNPFRIRDIFIRSSK